MRQYLLLATMIPVLIGIAGCKTTVRGTTSINEVEDSFLNGDVSYQPSELKTAK